MRVHLLVGVLNHSFTTDDVPFSSQGTIKEFGGIQCYISTPEGDYAKDKVVVYLSDVFGIPLKNNKVCVF